MGPSAQHALKSTSETEMKKRLAKEIEQQIQEIVSDVEAGQIFPWVATKRLSSLFRRRLELAYAVSKVDKRAVDHSNAM